MPLKKLSAEDVERFSKYEEIAMGLHVVRIDKDPFSFAFVVGDLVLVTLDPETFGQLEGLLREPWLRRDGGEWNEHASPGTTNERHFEEWLGALTEAEAVPDPVPRNGLPYGLIVPPWLPPAPPRPASIYGHLPFGWDCGENDVFYRFEPWPTSRRIDQGTRTIKHGTYACPASELPFNPTGFAAVARYALPSVLPACFRWELQPVARTRLDCGASVPLYGQSGGGVEVYFRATIRNRGPIANPVVLPPL